MIKKKAYLIGKGWRAKVFPWRDMVSRRGKDFQKHNLKQCSQITNDQKNAALLKKGRGIYSIKTPPSYQWVWARVTKSELKYTEHAKNFPLTVALSSDANSLVF